ncbi:DEAD/DEAH box helicase family protein [Clostridium botulinum]|uniref:DEAD/DEAH box helicase n=1 Tax=Clostridium botulinum TaxID=1491 RepID=UPI001C9A5D27|nr:DEAD/DEAH box helicase family protein [Clostridium botulinum]MBY6797703.1 DEAD/DEAH box helicase family protein [Clostridium botulinum]MBY6867232.1 DEAD/DEAH box helicase family protein [Clostridium botulinum]BDB03252.1 type III restriction endonuclease subunit R [Clostridium botulinum]
MDEVKIYKTKDLVLKVNKSYNPLELDLDSWDRFIDILCGDRYYQKEAIEKAIIYLASGNYKSLQELIAENWKNNLELRNRYKTEKEYVKKLQLKNKLFANLDLATGTGKSYVIYGIAQIMLGMGVIDKVLVLCPSITIENGLKEKFEELTSNYKLKESIPEDSVVKNPRIINGNNTIKNGDICVENIHAIYNSTGSSIRDSLFNNGEKVLVLNDESHHIFNKVEGRNEESRSIKKWKEFLQSEEYDFKYMLGFTGTAYIEDEYFNDVIYRYSLREAVDNNIVKMIDYVSKDENISVMEKFQKIYDNHQENKEKYSKIKPLTILVTKDVKNAKQLTTKFREFISENENIPFEETEEKVLIVTSANEHKLNVSKLKDIDNKSNSIEWIISVSMLTEGWDVKNVFQIVPWEDRAFNSKLLIAQVLGRGLRVPNEYSSPQPKVKVFNHDAWSRNIKGLIEEILEIEMKLYSKIITNGERSEYNFNLYNVSYEKIPQSKEREEDTTSFDYSKGYIGLISQVDKTYKETEYTDLKGENYTKKTKIKYETYDIDEVVNKIHEEFAIREWEGRILKLPNGEYGANNLPSKSELKDIIEESLRRVGVTNGKISDKNRQKILQGFGTLNRRKGKTIVYVKKVNEPILINTKNINRESLSLSNLKRDSSMFYSGNYSNEISEDIVNIFNEVIEDENLPIKSKKKINPYLFKTPLDLVFTKSEPERKFVEQLCKKENAKTITSWIKSRDQNFYTIEYSWKKGEHQKQHTFNPDFFIRISNNIKDFIIVVEIKADNDVSEENKAKFKYAKEHFKILNRELKNNNINQQYIFHFLSPVNYTEFFDYLTNGKLINEEFTSELEDLLDKY